jgi:Tol biopolymer transport system component
MGEVYKARDTRLDRTVAIKVLPAQFAADPRFRERFEREAKAISQLSHPNICTLHDIGHADGLDYLVMEYLEGETLAQRLLKGAVPLDQALQIAVQIADALDTAHRRGIVHRDLKPGNIMLTKSGAKLLDFGLAKASRRAITGSSSSMLPATVPMTTEGMILGTLQYMAPEQLEGKEADSRSDIFSLGAIIYEMTTGKRAFEGNSAANVIAAIVDRPLPPMSTLRPLTPPMLDRVASKCLAKNPDDRWQTAHDLSDELKWIAEHESHPIAGAFERRRPTRRLMYIAGGAALIGIVTALAWRTFDRPLSDDPAVRMTLAPPDRTEEFGRSAAVSPDGRWLTFIASTGGRQMLWVRAMNALESQPLAGTESASYPFWSPDSRHIGFFAGGKLKTVDAKGSPPRTLSDAYNGRGGTWAADGTIIYAPGFVDPLYRVDASGRDPKPITTVDPERAEDGHQWPWFLPDGRHFVFLVKSSKPEYEGIYVGSLDSGERVRLIAEGANVQYAKPGYLLFLRGQALMAQRFDARALTLIGSPSRLAEGLRFNPNAQHGFFAVSDTGMLVYALGGSIAGNRLVWVDRSGKLIRQVTESPRNHQHLTLSRDGHHIAVGVTSHDGAHIWVNRVPEADVSPVTFGRGFDAIAVWSRSGAELLWASSRPEFGFYRQPLNGSGSAKMVWRAPAGTTSAIANQPTDWSPDGTHLLFQSQGKNTGWDLWVLPLSGDQKAEPLIQTPSDDAHGQFSPDGRWIAYASNESGQLEVYVQRFPLSGTKSRVSVAGGLLPAWRRDGKELFFLEPGSERLMAVDVITETEDFRSNKPHLLFQLPATASAHGSEPGSHYGVTPDGQRFLVILQDEPVRSLNVVVNWDSDLPR